MELKDLRVIVIDDDCDSLEASAERIALYIPEDNILKALSAEEMIKLMNSNRIDLAFVDVEMSGTDGFSVAEYIHSNRPETKVVFLTGHTEVAAKSYDYEAFDFLPKPLNVARLKRTLDRLIAMETPSQQSQRRVAVETTKGFVLLSPKDIRYIVRDGRRSVIHCSNEQYTLWRSLDDLEATFEEFGFFRCHQSYLVPLERIICVSQSDFGRTYLITLNSGENIPVSQKRYIQLRQELKEYNVKFL